MKKLIWTGDADLANQIFGESYGVDWFYSSKKSSNVIVGGREIIVGQKI